MLELRNREGLHVLLVFCPKHMVEAIFSAGEAMGAFLELVKKRGR